MSIRDRLGRKASRRDVLKGILGTGAGIATGKLLGETAAEAAPVVLEVPPPSVQPYGSWQTMPFTHSTGGFGLYGTSPYPFNSGYGGLPAQRLKARGKRRSNCKQCGGPLDWGEFYSRTCCKHCGTYAEEE